MCTATSGRVIDPAASSVCTRVIEQASKHKTATAVTALVAGVLVAWSCRGRIYNWIHADCARWFFSKGDTVAKTEALVLWSLGHTMSVETKEESLPQEPIPPLEDSLTAFLEEQRPLLSAHDFAGLQILVERMKVEQGPRLQSLLTQYAMKEGGYHDSWFFMKPIYHAMASYYGLELNGNYLSGWFEPVWMDVAYLRARTPLFFSNWFSPGTRIQVTVQETEDLQVASSAYYVKGFLRHLSDIMHDRGNYARESQLQFSMGQYNRVFGCCQVAGLEKDELKLSFSKREKVHSGYILVVCKGYYYPVKVFHEDGREYSLSEIEHQIAQVMADASSKPSPDFEVGVLSADDRRIWAKNRALLQTDETQRRNLELLEGALFPLCLDERTPRDSQEKAVFVQKSVRSRFFGYALGLVVFQDGSQSFTNTHSPGEAHIVVLAGESQLDFLARRAVSKDRASLSLVLPKIPSLSDGVSLPDVKALSFDSASSLRRRVDAEDNTAVRELISSFHVACPSLMEEEVSLATEAGRVETMMGAITGTLAMQYCRVDTFGKKKIQKMDLSPDTFVQVALQIAWHRMHQGTEHEFVRTYQTGTKRLFKYGRTETIFPVTAEMVAFVKAFVTDADGSMALLPSVMERHRIDKEKAMTGRGFHRHLIALNVVASVKEMEEPVFASAPWKTPFRLTTSQTPFRQGWRDLQSTPFADGGDIENDGGGFIPAVPDGVGFSYKMMNDSISFFVTAYPGVGNISAEAFGEQVVQALQDLYAAAERR